ncbi:hypothetical protein [Pelomonas sp. KK5]|uniref:hypothetical protein n=1 Tax=Pelomonas sp. KK5 TaxID=1855730 RepID=UPI00117C6991|nr:hypothetical protein [Pelomonas sp. KK5]
MSNVTLSILDATGKSMASNTSVPASGSYGPIALASGTGPFRLAACGYAVDRYTCLYSVTQSGGTAQITPLTSAVVLLASGVNPSSPMSGAVTGLSATAVAAAQGQLQTALAPALADAGLASNADLLTTALTAGSRSGYDRLLDSVAVTVGQDGSPYVQLESRMGGGIVTLTGTGVGGELTIDAGAAGVTLAGISTLFTQMTAAMASASACSANMPGLMAPNARMNLANIAFTGADIGAGLCNVIGTGIFSDGTYKYGTKLLAPQLGRCDFSGSTPVCRVSMVAQTPAGALLTFAQNQSVAWQGNGTWLFYGDAQPFPTSAEVRVQRLRRVDGGAQVDSYLRSIGVGISTLSGALCARVTQADPNGGDVTLAYMKPGTGSTNLSIWTVDAVNGQLSGDPTTGAIRGNDDRWIPLPDGSDGDALVRNFAVGHSLKVALYSDDSCSTPASTFSLDLAAVPPLSTALASQPWPSLATASATALAGLKGAAAAKVNLSASWTLPSPPPALSTAQLCTDSLCNTGSILATLPVAPGALTAALSATLGSTALDASSFKQLRLNARNGDGLLLQADFQSCTTAAPGSACAVSLPLRQGMRVQNRRRAR